MNAIIQTENLGRKYRKKEALKHLTLAVPEGSIFAFLGPNGAGKTTTIKTFMNILSPTGGRASVLGVDSRKLGPTELAQIGYVSENQKYPLWMTVQQLLDYCRPFYPTWDKAFEAKLQDQFRLPMHAKIKTLSRGMQVKAALLSSLAYRPRLLVLDEPFSGLDPLVRDEFIHGILELSEQENWSVFISSHDIDEVERLADWVGVINEGELQLAEQTVSLQARFRQVEVVMTAEASLPAAVPKTWLNPQATGHTVRFVDSQYVEEKSGEILKNAFPSLTQTDVQPMSLREIFIALARTYQFAAR